MCLKLAGGDLETGRAQPLGKRLIKPLGVGGQRGIRKARPVALAAIRIQSKLRDHKQFAVDVGYGPIHFALRVCENAQVRNLVGKGFRPLFVVLFADPQENAQARTDFSDDLFAHVHSGLSESLNDGTHVKSNRNHGGVAGFQRNEVSGSASKI